MKGKRNDSKKWLYRAGIVAIWLLVWQLLSESVDNSILLVGPASVFRALFEKLSEALFWKTIFLSLLRISSGLLAGWILGLLFAACSAVNKYAEDFLKPLMTMMKTVPVAAFVVLFLIWFRSEYLAVAISLCVALPGVYFNTLEGIKSTDEKLLEMSRVFELHPCDRFFYIYRPALRPYWESCMKVTVGMSWKAGVAAEVIGTPDFSIGEQLYMSKIYLDTAGVLAWTIVIILLSILCEKVGFALWHALFRWQPRCYGTRRERKYGRADEPGEKDPIIKIHNLSKAYGENNLYRDFCAEYRKGTCCYFKTPSGSGKTTLFRLITGLENPDSGKIEVRERPAFMFQEDRLCEFYSALKNVELITGSREEAYKYLLPLLDKADLDKPCSTLSGGMKRRVAAARAFAAQRGIVLLDEPFAGLDEENRQRMQRYIEENGQDKAVLIATHV